MINIFERFLNETLNSMGLFSSSMSVPLMQIASAGKVILNSKLHMYFMDNFFKTAILIDASITACVFLIGLYPIINIITSGKPDTEIIFIRKKEIINKTSNVYRLDFYDRYILYLLLYTVSTINSSDYTKIVMLLLVIPNIQNKITNIEFINKKLVVYTQNKEIFLKYSISKVLLKFIEHLHIKIVKIPNINIFILYNSISWSYFKAIFYNYLFIWLLYTLRYYKSYYYRVIKYAYLTSTGYNFTAIDQVTAVSFVNLIINEKRWHDLNKMEIVNAFYVLISKKYANEYSSSYVSILLALYSFSSVWCITSLTKVIIKNVPLFAVLFNITLMYLVIKSSSTLNRNIVTVSVLTSLLFFNIDDIIITLFLLFNSIFYLILEEIYFFVKNRKNIKKVINKYNTKSIKDTLPFGYETI
jgi:hypothetical protein